MCFRIRGIQLRRSSVDSIVSCNFLLLFIVKIMTTIRGCPQGSFCDEHRGRLRLQKEMGSASFESCSLTRPGIENPVLLNAYVLDLRSIPERNCFFKVVKRAELQSCPISRYVRRSA